MLVVDRASGAVVRGPELFARGVAGFEGAEDEMRGEALRAIEGLAPQARLAVDEVQEALRVTIRRWLKRTTGKRPTVLPVVLELYPGRARRGAGHFGRGTCRASTSSPS